MINKNQKLTKSNIPFPHVVIENFFDENFYNILEQNFPSEQKFQSIQNKVNRMNYDTTYGDTLYRELLDKNKEYKELHNYIYSNTYYDRSDCSYILLKNDMYINNNIFNEYNLFKYFVNYLKYINNKKNKIKNIILNNFIKYLYNHNLVYEYHHCLTFWLNEILSKDYNDNNEYYIKKYFI